MNHQEMEIEAKFYLADMPGLIQRIEAAGGALIQPRVFESNLRFDTPDQALTQAHRVLRLRQDERARLTYKGAAEARQTVGVRQEIEFEVSSFESARHFLEALGYQVSMCYEKYRRTYALGAVEVMVDEMPFGNFAEIEASSPAAVQAAAEILGLHWEARCAASYLELFARVKARRGLAMEFLTFAAFANLSFHPEDFDLLAANEGTPR